MFSVSLMPNISGSWRDRLSEVIYSYQWLSTNSTAQPNFDFWPFYYDSPAALSVKVFHIVIVIMKITLFTKRPKKKKRANKDFWQTKQRRETQEHNVKDWNGEFVLRRSWNKKAKKRETQNAKQIWIKTNTKGQNHITDIKRMRLKSVNKYRKAGL